MFLVRCLFVAQGRFSVSVSTLPITRAFESCWNVRTLARDTTVQEGQPIIQRVATCFDSTLLAVRCCLGTCLFECRFQLGFCQNIFWHRGFVESCEIAEQWKISPPADQIAVVVVWFCGAEVVLRMARPLRPRGTTSTLSYDTRGTLPGERSSGPSLSKIPFASPLRTWSRCSLARWCRHLPLCRCLPMQN